MGRPLNKRNFGSDALDGQIEVSYHDGALKTGYIVKQLGSKKFRVTDGATTFVCFLKWTGAPSAAGEMTIGITDEDGGGTSLVRKISGRKATLANGEVVGWRYSDTSTALDGRAEIDESAGYGDGIDVAAPDLVATTVYVITEVGDTDWVTEQAGGTPPASNDVGEVFTAGAAGTGTGVAQVYVP